MTNTMNLGNRIRELRKKNNVTQEQLAGALNLSPQAVSKWEMNVGYPDISLLPAIAAYFRVSMDELFAYDVLEIDRKIEEIQKEASPYFWSDLEKAEAIYLKGIAQYPGSDTLKAKLLDLYECHMRSDGRMELLDRAVAIANRLIRESGDGAVVNQAKANLASIYIMTDRYNDAKAIIESMPVIWPLEIHDRMRCATHTLRGKDKQSAAAEWRPYAWQDLFACCAREGEGYAETGDYENALIYYQESVDVIERFMFTTHTCAGTEYPIPYTEANHMATYLAMAGCYLKLGRLAECDSAIEKAHEVWSRVYPSFETEAEESLEVYRRYYRENGLDTYKPAP